jgi:hypothetical protein
MLGFDPVPGGETPRIYGRGGAIPLAPIGGILDR